MKIGIDLDGVCYDFGEALRYYLVEHEGFDPEALTHPKVWDFFLEWGLSVEDYLAAYARGVDAGVVLLHGGPHEGCVDTLAKLRENGHTLHIVTYRTVGNRAVQNTMEWLRIHQVPYDTITFSKDKTIIPVDAFIEDNMDNFLALQQTGTKAFLMDRPWNQEIDTMYRVFDWEDFYSVVEEVERGIFASGYNGK